MGEREAAWQEVRHVCQDFPSAHDFMVAVDDVPAVLAKLAALADEEPPTEADISVVVQHLDPSVRVLSHTRVLLGCGAIHRQRHRPSRGSRFRRWRRRSSTISESFSSKPWIGIGTGSSLERR